MSSGDDGTKGFDGPTEPHEDLPTTSSGEPGEGSDEEFSISMTLERALADLKLDPTSCPGALGRLGHYDVLDYVGSGAMGIVLRAFDNRLHRTVAIKVLSSHLITSEQARMRFVREARAAAALNHPNVVIIHAVDDHRGVPYLVMEYVDGVSLQQRVARTAPMFTIDILRISQQIAVGLAAAHKSGVVHRDIKPANIMLEDGIERVKITDFGLAKAAMDNSNLTSFGKMIGTPPYMSPEQVVGETLDGRSDLYSLGCVMYAMVSGGPPFRGGHCLAIAHRVRSEAPRSLRESHPDVPRFLDDIILRLLEKTPQARFASADELAAELTHWLKIANAASGSGAFTDSNVARAAPPPSEAKRPRRSFTSSLTIGGLLLSGAALLAAMMMQRPPNPPTPSPKPGEILPSADPFPTDALRNLTADPGPPLPFEQRPLLTVSRDPDAGASAATISGALEQVEKPWTRIEVLDDGVYHEVLTISGSKHAGLTLTTPQGAVLQVDEGRAPVGLNDTTSLIRVFNVAQVTIRGFRLRPTIRQCGICVRGYCPGLDISEIRSTQPPEGLRTFVLCHKGACGSIDTPIRFHHNEAETDAGGFYLAADSKDPIAHLMLESNRVVGHKPKSLNGPMVALTEDPGRSTVSHYDVRAERNTFAHGLAGVSLYITSPAALRMVQIRNNSFFGLGCLFLMNQCDIAEDDLKFASNLIFSCQQILVTDREIRLPDEWFQDNHWETEPGDSLPLIRQVAEPQSSIPMQSRNPRDSNFLHPEADALPDLADPFPGAHPRPAR